MKATAGVMTLSIASVFSKQNLLLDSYQTPDVSHEENWWQLAILSYAQLYLANTLASLLPKPWEKHLPEYQESGDQQVKTPSQNPTRLF